MLKTGCCNILMLLLTCCNYTNNAPPHAVEQYDTLLITQRLQRYDSVYNLYDAARLTSDTAFNLLKRADLFLDTLINNNAGYCSIKDSVTRAHLLNAVWSKAIDLNDMSDFAGAEELLNKYLLCCEQHGLQPSSRQAYAHKVIADIYSRFGDYSLAVYHKRKSISYYTATADITNLSSEIIGISIPFHEAGMYDSAVFYLEKGIAFKATAPKRLLSMYTGLAENYLAQNKLPGASKALQDGLAYFNAWEKEKQEYDRLSGYKAVEAALLLTKNNYAASQYACQQSLYYLKKEYKNKRAREVGKVYNRLGDVYMLQHKNDSAIHCYNLALWNVSDIDTADIFSVPLKAQLYAENTIPESLDCKAGWMIKNADSTNKKRYLQCAVQCYSTAMDVEYKLMQHFNYDASKIAMLQESRTRSEKAIAACYQLYRAQKNERWVTMAFSFAERNKAFVLLESIKRNLAAAAPLSGDTLYTQMQQAGLRYAGYERQLAESNINHDTNATTLAKSNLAITDEAIQKLKTGIRYTNNSSRQLLDSEDSVSMAACNKLLPNSQAAMAEYFKGDSAAYLFIITKDGPPAMYKLADSLSANIKDLLYFFTDRKLIIQSPLAYNAAAYKLYKQLQLDKAGKQINSLVIIPDDELYFIPFDALISSPSASYNLAGYHYLVKDYEVKYAYSATMLLRQKEYNSNNKKAILFAPVFEQNERGFQPLPFSKQEAGSINNSIQTNTFIGNEAAIGNFRKQAGYAGIIHITTHAAASGIPRIEFYDSTLYLDEIYAMQLQANLVVLSACETGIGKIEKSEGALSLARGFFYAGAHNIITSLWNVDDDATAQIFGNFYQLINNNNYSEALHKAKQAYLKPGKNNDKYSPYYWAGIVYIGYTKPVNNDYVFIVSGILLIIIFLLVVYILKRKHQHF